MGASGVGSKSSLRDFDRELALFELKTRAPPRMGGAENLHPTPDGLPPAPVENLPLPRLSVLLPALNEEGGVRHVLRRIPWSSLSSMGFRLDVNLLDGHSLDRTREAAKEYGADVFVQTGRGKGSALREFLPSLRSEYCVILDSDATYPPEMIPVLAEKLRRGAPVVLGSRFRGRIEEGAMSTANRLGNRLLSAFASWLFGQPVSDVCSGMWGFRTDVLKSFGLTANGFDVEADFFAECALRGIPIEEVPIHYRNRIGVPKLRIRAGLRIAGTLLLKRIRDAR